jgi:transposase
MGKRIVLQHDNALPHIAHLILGKIENFGWKVLPHPPYSPDLALSDYRLFWTLENSMRSQHYKNDNAVCQTVCT